MPGEGEQVLGDSGQRPDDALIQGYPYWELDEHGPHTAHRVHPCLPVELHLLLRQLLSVLGVFLL